MSDPIDVTKAIRKRAGMYVGDPEDGCGLHNLVEFLLVDALDAECSRLAVTLHADRSVGPSCVGYVRSILAQQHRSTRDSTRRSP